MSSYDQSKGKGKILRRADSSTIQDKFMVGYQGWFTCGGDGEPVGPGHHGWLHWFDAPIPYGGRVNTDLWPDTSSYSPSELFPAPGLKTASGEQVFLFSSRHPKTVQRHFHWMAQHGVDGAFLQRFAGQCDLEAGNEGIRRIRDEVGERVREAAEKEGRTFAIMYDVSGVPADRIQKVLEHDWVHLMRNQGVLDSPNYLREKGKPVIALWGFGFENAGHTPALVRTITTYFRNMTPGGAYIMAGTPAHWRTAESDADRDPEFLDVWLNDFDAISPWTVGRYRNEQDADDFADTKMKGDVDLIKKRNEEGRWRKIDYIPVVLPGGSGFNLSQGKWGFNDIKRNGGRFLWKQIFNAKHQGVRIMYGAMWDEYDEGTAFMPVVEKKLMLPVSDKHPFLSLDEDGYDVPSDWYMRICGFAAEGLRSERKIHESFPSKELQDYWSSRPKYEDVDHKSGDFVSGASKQAGGSSGGGDGQSYQDWLAAQKEDKEELPPPPYSLEADEELVPQVRTALAVAGPSGTAVSAESTSSHEVSTPVTVPVEALADPRLSSPLATGTMTAIETSSHRHSRPTRHTTSGPPPVNTSSRPQLQMSSHPSGAAGHDRNSSISDSANARPTHPASSEYSSALPAGPTTHDPMISLANDFSRQGIGLTQPTSSPPPIHAPRPGAVQGDHSHRPDRPHSRPQSQTGSSQLTLPTSALYPPTQTSAPQNGGTLSQGQWPPPEWGIDSRHQSPPPTKQSSNPGQISGGVNLSRPQTSPYPLPVSQRPHSAMNTRPSYPTGAYSPSHAGRPPYGPAPPSTYAPGGGPSIPGVSTYNQERPYPASDALFPLGPSSGPYTHTSSHPGQISSSSYGSSGYPPSASHGPGFGGPPHVSPPHSPGPGASYYSEQSPTHGFPVVHGSSYPGQNSYGDGPQYGAPHSMGYPPNEGPFDGGGFHVPHAPGGFGGSQPQSSGYGPAYIPIPETTPYSAAATLPSSWYPGSSAAPPMHPGRPPTHSPYSSSSGPSFPTSPGLLDSALNAVDRVAGKKTRDQLEAVAQSGTKLLNKFTK